MKTYANGRRLFDADSHLMETIDWLTAYAKPGQEGLVPPLVSEKGGANMRAAIEAAQVRRASPQATAALLEQPIVSGPKGWAAYGATDPVERSHALDLLGFEQQLVFPTFAVAQFASSSDDDVVYAGTDMLNRRMADFCRRDSRLLAVGFVSLRDPARAAAAAEAAIADGVRALWVSSEPVHDRSPSHLAHDPVWALCEQHGVPVILHIGSGRGLDRRYHNAGHPKVKDWLGGGENLRGKDFPGVAHSAQNFLTAMIYDQVFDRFPRLMCGVIELGATWVPGFLRMLDQGHMAFRKSEPLLAGLSALPSEIFKRHIRVSLFPYEDAGWLIDQCGPDIFMFASDWPHPEGGRDPLGRFDQTLDASDTAPAARDAFYSGNFASLLNITI